MTTEVKNLADESRYVVQVDGVEAGFAEYHLRGKSIYFFYHTVVQDEFEGRGLGSQLVRKALDDVRAAQGTVVPICPFFASWLKKHPDYDDLVDHQLWDRISNQKTEEE
jgi:predicted GNAT family acetyltransferase